MGRVLSAMKLIGLLLILVLISNTRSSQAVAQETTFDACCPGAKVEGLSYGLVYPNNTFGLENSCGSSCPYLLHGAEDTEDSLEVKCFDTPNNEDICVLPRPQKRRRNSRPIPVDQFATPRKTRGRDVTKMCGYVYEHKDYRGLRGWTPESQAGMSGNLNRRFDNRISSVRVEDGCEMHLFRDFNLRGPSRTFSRSSAWVAWSWNDMFSSYMCTCHHLEVTVALAERKCSFSTMRNGASCKLYQLSDLSWNTAEELHARARKNRNRRKAARGWEGALVDEDNYQVGYVKAAMDVKKVHSHSEFKALTKLGIFHINSEKDTNPIETIDFDVLGAEASAKVSPTYAGGEAKLIMAKGSVSIFDLQLGAGVSSEVGYDIDNYSVKVKLLGTGVSLGGQTGICAADNCFGISFNRLFSGK